MLSITRKLVSITAPVSRSLLPSSGSFSASTATRALPGGTNRPGAERKAERSNTARRATCAALALALNGLIVWGAFAGTATVPPLRAWERPHALSPAAATHLAYDGQQQVRPAALVE